LRACFSLGLIYGFSVGGGRALYKKCVMRWGSDFLLTYKKKEMAEESIMQVTNLL